MEDRNDLARHLMSDMPDQEREHFIDLIAQAATDELEEARAAQTWKGSRRAVLRE